MGEKRTITVWHGVYAGLVVAAMVIGAFAGYLFKDAGKILSFGGEDGGRAGAAAKLQNRAATSLARLPPQVFDHWSLNCVQNMHKAKTCDLVLRGVQKGGKVVLNLIAARDAKGQAIFVVETLPGVMLSNGIELTIGKNPAMKLNFTACGPRACEAVIALDGTLESYLIGASDAAISIVAIGGQTVNYRLPVNGFANGYAAWKVAMGTTSR